MTDAERELLFYIARALIHHATPHGEIERNLERLLARAIDDAAKEKRAEP